MKMLKNIGVCILLFIQLVLSKSPAVTVELQASWRDAPLALELLETICYLNSSLFYPKLEATLKYLPNFSTEYDLYNLIVEDLDSYQVTLLDLHLASHVMAPAVETYYQLYRESISVNTDSFDGTCDSWASYEWKQFCTVESLKLFLEKFETQSSNYHLKLFPFDHIYETKGREFYTAAIALYCDVLSPSCLNFYDFLSEHSRKNDLSFVIRWKPSKSWNARKLTISGYGVELALKSTEYKATDDQKLTELEFTDSIRSESFVDKMIHGHDFEQLQHVIQEAPALHEFKSTLIDTFGSESIIRSMKNTDMARLGFKTVAFILKSPVPLVTLRAISQDFPIYAFSLANLTENFELNTEILSNQQIVNFETSTLVINGLTVPTSKFDPFSLIKTISIESQTVQKLVNMGFTVETSKEMLLNLVVSDKKLTSHEAYDLRDEWEKTKFKDRKKSTSVFWWNNIEEDSRYSKWPKSIYEVLRSMGGGVPQIRKNMFNVIFAVDLNTLLGLETLKFSLQLITSNVPIRFGFLPLLNIGKEISVSEMIARCFLFFNYELGKKASAEFLTLLFENFPSVSGFSEVTLRVFYEKHLKKHSSKASRNASFTIVAKTPRVYDDIDETIALIYEKNQKFGLNLSMDEKLPGYMFANGIISELTAAFPQQLSSIMQYFVGTLQKLVYLQHLRDSEDVYQFFLNYFGAKTYRNPLIEISKNNPLKVIEYSSDYTRISDLEYFSVENDLHLLTFWVYGNYSLPSFRQSMLTMLNSVFDSDKRSLIRILFVNTGYELDLQSCHELFVNTANEYSISSIEAEMITKICKKQNRKLISFNKKLSHFMVVNGRIIGPFPNSYSFSLVDLDFIVLNEIQKATALANFLKSRSFNTSNIVTDTLIQCLSVIRSSSVRHLSENSIFDSEMTAETLQRSDITASLKLEHSSFNMGSKKNSLVDVVALLNPMTEQAQRISAILEELSSLTDLISIKIVLGASKIIESELPIKRFYRHSFKAKSRFSQEGSLVHSHVRFDNLPLDPLLTMSMETPQAWIVMPKTTPYDLDNIKLKDVESTGINALMELKYILVEGHALEKKTMEPPRGLQFILGTMENPSMVDTIVMANLGYFQLKASPGILYLQIMEGKSSEIYEISKVEDGRREASVDKSVVEIILNKFEGSILYTQVSKKPGKEKEDVLEQTDSHAGGFFSNIFSWNQKVEPKFADINIFSVASGHLYERFLRIMILSVMKQTKHSVKFWFIEDFLSPQFKNFIPYMSQKFKFEYELVTYRWPKWLRAQTEKQRIIWAYKILFLDVLFPLNLDKVIFVDADQIVRADLKELVDLDINGAPYAYTPFCNSRKETEGFRFWNQGYWKNHLKGRPYHISALYVVDLNKFRKMAAGDRLRQQYQVLSADKNSLSNLDQDLPNDMQEQVPIFSLPLEWLWCETWCDDQSLKKAKTIDLCNNPLTKEPKLDRAQRLLPEWNTFDQEARQLFNEWKQRVSQSEKFGDRISHDEL